MQLIKPQKRIMIRQSLAMLAGNVAVVVETGNVGRTLKIAGWVVIYIGNLEDSVSI